jgi:cytoskeleton protein RodZ
MTEIQTVALAPENLSAGRTLAAAREARGMSVEDVAERLKFARRQIESLEADNYAALPGIAIVRGMIRNYARLLELEAAPLLEDLQRRLAPGAAELHLQRLQVPFPAGGRTSSRLPVVFGLIIIIAIAAVLIDWGMREREAAVEARVQPAVEAAPTDKAEVTSSAAAPVAPAPAAKPSQDNPTALKRMARVELHFDGESWVEVVDGGGTVLTSQLNRGGASQVVEGAAPLSLVIGNPSAVQVKFNEGRVDLAPHTRVGVARLTLQ